MGGTAGKYLRKKNKSNRKRWSNIFRFSSSCKTKLYDLPLEVLDMILQKSYLHWIFNSPTKQRDEEVFRCLISVDVCFNQRMIRKRFKRTIWRLLRDFYGKPKKRSAIIRNNRNYLLENIQPNDELIASLLSLNCITQEQSHFIQRQNSTQDKNYEILYVVESFDEAKFTDFVKCLRQTNQKTVTRIIEIGGGTTKIKLKFRGAKCTASVELQLLRQKIEDVRNGTKSWSHQTDKIISQLEDVGIEILNSHLDRQTVVVWIWCRSQSALQHFQKLYESNDLRDVFVETFQTPISMEISVDRNQFKKTIGTVVCAVSISFVQNIKIPTAGNLHLRSLTKLRNEIYIIFSLYSRPNVIHVFEDKNPFNWKKQIEFAQIKSSDDIGSNKKDNCLYITDWYGKCVWKITREEYGRHKLIKWLNLDYKPRLLSVSTDGHFLAYNDVSTSLMIYGSDAELIRSIQLPTEIRNPIHAVETSIGNFIILSVSYELVMNRWGISELSRDGQMVIRRFIPSNETQRLNEPRYLAIDSDDRVFVADSGNDRVILFDSDLRWNRLLIPTGDKEQPRIDWPEILYYDKGNRQLIVGECQRLNVYSINWK